MMFYQVVCHMSTLFIFIMIFAFVSAKKSDSEKKKLNIDKGHLAVDFMKVFGTVFDIFSEKDLDFQYFAAHDLDNNKKLDGLELFIALDHEFEHEAEHGGAAYSPADVEDEVDFIFSEHDLNNDGFLDYKEFKRVQKTHSIDDSIAKDDEKEEDVEDIL